MIIVVRIAGRVKNKIKENETLKRLKLNRKFAAVLIRDDDVVRLGMVKSVSHMVAYGKIDDAFVEDLKSKRTENEGVFFLHPPVGGFKKSSKVSTPKGILGKHEDITKLVGRMLGEHSSKKSEISRRML